MNHNKLNRKLKKIGMLCHINHELNIDNNQKGHKTQPMMNKKYDLTKEKIRFLKKHAHHLKPVVMLGKKGLSDEVINEIKQALLAHELIKIQLLPEHKKELEMFINILTKKTASVFVAQVGNILVVFKEHPKKSRFKMDDEESES